MSDRTAPASSAGVPRRGGRDREERLSALAAAQHGVVRRRQLLEIGFSSAAIGRGVEAGRLRVLHNGVYLVGPVEPDRAREMAAVLAGGPAAALSHTNALVPWRLLRAEPPRPVHVSVPAGRGRHRPGIVFHSVSAWDDDERTVLDGIPITTPARTLVDAAGMLGRRELELALDTAEREGLIRAQELTRLPERYARRPGMAMLRSILEDHAGPRLTESQAEWKCLELVRASGLPPPHTDVAMGPYRLDIFWPDVNLAIEVDGRAYHSSTSRFEGDRRKDNWLRARGIEVIHVTWRQMTRDPVRTAVDIGRAYTWAEARRRAMAATPGAIPGVGEGHTPGARPA